MSEQDRCDRINGGYSHFQPVAIGFKKGEIAAVVAESKTGKSEYRQRADTPTGFCDQCGRIPSQCLCRGLTE